MSTWQQNRDHMLRMEQAGMATPGMLEWLANWRAKDAPLEQSGMQNDGLGFGHNGGSSGSAYSDSWGIDVERDNPNGITSVQQGNVGFSGNPEHFITGDAARDLHEQMNQSQPAAEPEEPAAPRPEIKASTPFLDAYMRAREASKAEGPATKMMKEWME